VTPLNTERKEGDALRISSKAPGAGDITPQNRSKAGKYGERTAAAGQGSTQKSRERERRRPRRTLCRPREKRNQEPHPRTTHQKKKGGKKRRKPLKGVGRRGGREEIVRGRSEAREKGGSGVTGKRTDKEDQTHEEEPGKREGGDWGPFFHEERKTERPGQTLKKKEGLQTSPVEKGGRTDVSKKRGGGMLWGGKGLGGGIHFFETSVCAIPLWGEHGTGKKRMR